MMSDDLGPIVAELYSTVSTLRLVVEQNLADQMRQTVDPIATHRDFTDRLHARADAVASAAPHLESTLESTHSLLDSMMRRVEVQLGPRPR